MARAWQLAAVGVVVVSAYVLLASRDHEYMDETGPGAGFLPFWVGLLGILTGIALFAMTTWRGVARAIRWQPLTLPQILRISTTVATIAGAALALEWLGFRVTTFLMLTILVHTYGARSWWRAGAFAAGGSLLVFYVFYYLLEVPLPLGVFGF
jgi:hypothetical protein